MNPVILIPAYNPPSTFSELLDDITTNYSIPIIIIDDGSNKIVDGKGNIIIHNKVNRGKGYSLIKGMHYAFQKGFTHAVTLDADSQHNPQFIKLLLMQNPEISLVYGFRNFSCTMPIHRRCSNIISSWIISVLIGNKVLDSQCGFRRYHLEKVLKHTYNELGFQFESEVLIKLGIQGESFHRVQISTLYSNEKSAINNLTDTFKFIRLIFKFFLIKLGTLF